MRIALHLEYHGESFYGFQSQQGLPTIQSSLEKALSSIADTPIQVFCAGRTDAKVHATGQVVHFDTDANRPLHAWVMGANTLLPKEIAVHWAKEVDDTFHARFSALSRRYRYIIYNARSRPAILSGRVTWRYQPLSIELMQKSVSFLIGEHDFTSFRSSQCESTTPMRYVKEISVKRQDDLVIIEIEANAFLHHMVRNIVGVLLKIGEGRMAWNVMNDILLAKDREKAAETAPPDGLYLTKVTYPEEYGFLEKKESFLFL